MNQKTTYIALAVAVAGVITGASAQAQNPNFTPGDLVLGFRATGGVGSGTVIEAALGDTATVFRDATTNLLNIVNIGSLLDSTYGIGAGNAIAWYERTDLLFGAAGVWIGLSIGLAVFSVLLVSRFHLLTRRAFMPELTKPA